MYSFLAGLTLLAVAILSRATMRDPFHPSFIFPAIWGGGLCLIAFTPLLGFYAVESDALLIFILGGAIFSAVSICISLFAKSFVHKGFFCRELNFNDLFLLFAFMHLLVLPVAYSDLSALGSDFAQLSYHACALSVSCFFFWFCWLQMVVWLRSVRTWSRYHTPQGQCRLLGSQYSVG